MKFIYILNVQTVSVFIGQELPNGPFFDNLSFLCKFRIIYQRFDQELLIFDRRLNCLSFLWGEFMCFDGDSLCAFSYSGVKPPCLGFFTLFLGHRKMIRYSFNLFFIFNPYRALGNPLWPTGWYYFPYFSLTSINSVFCSRFSTLMVLWSYLTIWVRFWWTF